MNRLSRTLLSCLCLLASSGLAARAQAAEARLLRSAETPAVYFTYATDADSRVRFAFPNERIFRGWYGSFDAVETVSAATLASYRFAGVVFHRPGSLVKITTDPKTYLVLRNGELRWIETEAVARGLFGDAWARRVEDVSDAFFAAYRVGPSIASTSAIAGSPEALPGSESIAANQGVERLPIVDPVAPVPSVPPAATSTVMQARLFLRLSKSGGIRPNESVGVGTYADGSLPQRLTLTINGAPAAACVRTQACLHSFTHQLRSTAASYRIEAEGTFDGGVTLRQTLTLPVIDAATGGLRLDVSKAEALPFDNIDLRAEWSDRFIPARRIALLVDGIERKSCFDAIECTLAYGIEGTAGTTVQFNAITDDTAGQRWTTATSTVTIVANEAPALTASANASTLFTGDAATVNATAADGDGIAFVEIYRDDTRVARCERPSCTYVTPTLSEAGWTRFRVVAEDLRGSRRETALEPILVVGTVR